VAHVSTKLQLVEEPPIFVLCLPRSGSTLLRKLLDAHPEVAAPAEGDLAYVCELVAALCKRVMTDEEAATSATHAICQDVAARSLGAYAEATQKGRWCDKSLSSLVYADRVHEIFPNARFVCLYRNCLDSINSLIETGPWGYKGYGVETYARTYSDNLVHGFALFWLERMEKLIAFEHDHPDSCVRVRYEDLVRQPAATLATLFDNLGLSRIELGELERQAFSPRSTTSTGPGDRKFLYTDRIDSDRVERGWRVPHTHIAPEIIKRIQVIHRKLGYPRIGEYGHLKDVVASCHDSVQRIRSLIERGISDRANGDPTRLGAVRLVLDDARCAWVVDYEFGKVRDHRWPATCTIHSDTETLLSVASGSSNVGDLVQQGRLRLNREPELKADQRFNKKDTRDFSVRQQTHFDALVDLLAGGNGVPFS
jgi:hypothetical protein